MLQKSISDRYEEGYLAAYFHYERKRSYDEVVEDFKNLGISKINRTKVQRLIKQAEKDGLIKTTVNAPLSLRLSRKLVEHFHTYLKEAVVSVIGVDPEKPSHSYIENRREAEEQKKAEEVKRIESEETAKKNLNKEIIRYSIAHAAADYIINKIEDNDTIGLAGGTTLREVVKQLDPERQPSHIEVYPITISKGFLYDISPNAVVAGFCAKYNNARGHALEVPHFINITREDFMREQKVQDILNEAGQAKILVIGIGTVTDESLVVQSVQQSKIDKIAEIRKKAKGDILDIFIDSEGEPIDCEWNNQAISIDLKKLKEAAVKKTSHHVIGVAGGSFQKAEAIYSALPYINVLITDDWTAARLLEMRLR